MGRLLANLHPLIPANAKRPAVCSGLPLGRRNWRNEALCTRHGVAVWTGRQRIHKQYERCFSPLSPCLLPDINMLEPRQQEPPWHLSLQVKTSTDYKTLVPIYKKNSPGETVTTCLQSQHKTS